MSKYSFYYDESEHSRKISYTTISASNYYDNFITMIVGWADSKADILQRHADFENKYANRKDRNGEIKSTTLQQKQLEHGFASLNKQNTQFVSDFLSLFDEDIHIYFTVSSKIEYLVLQLFQGYRDIPFLHTDLMLYSIVKTLVIYRPEKVIECIYESPEEFLLNLKEFFVDRIECNKKNPQLKQRETEAFQQILFMLDVISDDLKIDWDYHMPFDGFKKYLEEMNITNYELIIDKEGNERKTIKAAHEIGLDNLAEADSKEYQGLRIADMLAGIIAKLLKGINESLRYQSVEESTNKKIFSTDWFCLNENQLELYKKLYRLICEWKPAWYKSYAGIYPDDLVALVTLLNYMNRFESAEQIRANIDRRGEHFNSSVCEQLEMYFERRRCKLPIEPVVQFDEESYLNQRGGKVYFDSRKQPLLPLHEGSQILDVLSVGIDRKFTPIVTIQENGEAECFRLPNELSGWVYSVVGMATDGINFFPAKVIFSNINGRYYANIL